MIKERNMLIKLMGACNIDAGKEFYFLYGQYGLILHMFIIKNKYKYINI